MSDESRPVKRCVCFDKSFVELKASGLQTVAEIAKKFGCTTGCGLCRPYVERMIATGQTEFEIIADP